MIEEIKRAAELIEKSRYTVAFTGAGVSQESGIPTFRDPGGIWDIVSPEEFGTPGGLFSTLLSKPDKLREFLKNSLDTIRRAKPNPGHIALSELEKMGLLRAVITQNIDNLHQEANTENVYELHGNLYRFRCIECGYTKKFRKEEAFAIFDEIIEGELTLNRIIEKVPKCFSCGSAMRPDVVLFGEPVQQLEESFAIAAQTETMLVLGTSGTVYPAALIPRITKERGGWIIEINPYSPGYTSLATISIRGKSGEVMPLIVEEIKKIRKRKGGLNEKNTS